MPDKRPMPSGATFNRGLLKKARKRMSSGKATAGDLALLQQHAASLAATKSGGVQASGSNERAMFESIYGTNALPRLVFQQSLFMEKQRLIQITQKELNNLFFWILTESMGTKPKWVWVDNKALIPCIAVVIIDGEHSTAEGEHAFTKADCTKRGDIHVRLRVKNTRHPPRGVVDRLLSCELSSGDKKKQARRHQRKHERKRCTIEELLMTPQQLKDHGYLNVVDPMTVSSIQPTQAVSSPDGASSGTASKSDSDAPDASEPVVWVEGKFGPKHCRNGAACADLLCGFAHPTTWPHHPKDEVLHRPKITRQLSKGGKNIITTKTTATSVERKVRPVAELRSVQPPSHSAELNAPAATVYAMDCEMVETEINDSTRQNSTSEVRCLWNVRGFLSAALFYYCSLLGRTSNDCGCSWYRRVGRIASSQT